MDWIQYINEKENQAIKELYSTNKTKCHGWLKSRYGFSYEIIDELYHQSVVTLYMNVKRKKLVKIDGKIENYLIGICKNLARGYTKNKGRYVLKDEFPTLVFSDEIAEKQLQENRILTIEQNLAKIGDNCQEILKRFYFEKKSMEEIKIDMGYTSVDAVKTRKYKCIKKLQKLVLN